MTDQTQIPTALLTTDHIDRTQPPFILVDGSYYLFRAFHGINQNMQNSQGLHTNAIFGTLKSLKKLINTYQPTHMAVAFDTKAPTFRHEMSEFYKANRPKMPDELAEQVPYVHRMIQAMGIPLLMIDGVEADDIIGTLARRAVTEGHHVVISTGDKDMCQLVNDGIIVENSFDDKRYDVAGVKEKFGVEPRQMIDYLTLMGDASDGIQGVAGIGGKTASKLLNDFDNLENLFANLDKLKGKQKENLENSRESVVFDKKLATIVTDLDIVPDWQALRIVTDASELADTQRELFTELEFKSELNSLNHPNHPANVGKYVENPSANADFPTDLFGGTADIRPLTSSKNDNKKWQTITTDTAFNELVKKLETAPHFVLDTETTAIDWQVAELVGMSFCLKAHEAYYLPFTHVNDNGERLQENLDREQVLAVLKPILENPQIGKIGQHLKYDAHILANYGINLNINYANWEMDTMLASYVINAVATRHGMDDLAKHYLHTQTISFEDVAGKGAKQITFDKVPLQTASDYACEDADITFQLFELFSEKLKAEPNNAKLLHQIEIPVAQILCEMEGNGILINKAFLGELSARFDEKIQALEKIAFEQAGGEFNVASPKQLGEVLFERLGLSGGKKTKTGQYSTSEATLATIDHPLVETVLEHRSLSKLKSTYTDALANVADSQDRVHTSYHQALTSTGRLSSTEPNLQNIPIRTDTGRLIRQAFIAPKGRKVLSADYSQIELRLMAHFANDPVLIKAFNEGHDIHRATSAEILGKAFDDVTSEERRRAKAINFGLLYGMSEFGLAKQLGVSRQEAQDYIKLYFARYPTVRAYMQATRQMAHEQGYITTILGRKLHTPDIQHLNRNVRQAAERAAINAPLQGSAADIIKLAMIAVHDLFERENLNAHAKMLLQVHDELVFEVDSDKAEMIGEKIKTAMQNVLTNTAKQLGWDVNFAVPLVVEVGIGDNWDEAHWLLIKENPQNLWVFNFGGGVLDSYWPFYQMRKFDVDTASHKLSISNP